MRWNPHPLVFGMVVSASAALVFWGAGRLGGMEATRSLEAFWQALTGNISHPAEAIAMAPVVMTVGFLALFGLVLRAIVWAFFGAFFWLLGILAGGILAARRGRG